MRILRRLGFDIPSSVSDDMYCIYQGITFKVDRDTDIVKTKLITGRFELVNPRFIVHV